MEITLNNDMEAPPILLKIVPTTFAQMEILNGVLLKMIESGIEVYNVLDNRGNVKRIELDKTRAA